MSEHAWAQNFTSRGELQGSGIYHSSYFLYQRVRKLKLMYLLLFINIHNKHRHTHTHTSIHKWFDHYTNFHSAENNVCSRIFKSPSKHSEIQKLKYFNRILYIALFDVILGYVTLKLKIES